MGKGELIYKSPEEYYDDHATLPSGAYHIITKIKYFNTLHREALKASNIIYSLPCK